MCLRVCAREWLGGGGCREVQCMLAGLELKLSYEGGVEFERTGQGGHEIYADSRRGINHETRTRSRTYT